MAKKLEKPSNTEVDKSFFDNVEEQPTTSKSKRKKSNNIAIGIASFLIIAVGVGIIVSSNSGNKVSTVPDASQVVTTEVADTTLDPKQVEVVQNGQRDAVKQIDNMVSLMDNWDSIGDATLTIDRVDNNEENKAARYYFYDPYDESSYGYRVKYNRNPDGNSTSFGWRTSTEYCYLYSVLEYKGNKYLGLTGTNDAIRRTTGTKVSKFNWITLPDSLTSLTFNNKTAGVLESETKLPVIKATAINSLNSDGTTNFFTGSGEEDTTDTNGTIKTSSDKVSIETDDNGVSIDSILNSVQVIVSEKEQKENDDKYVQIKTDEDGVVSLDDLTVEEIYSLIPDFDTSTVSVNYKLSLADEMQNVLMMVNSFVKDAINNADATKISASSTEASYKMNSDDLTNFITGLQNSVSSLQIENKILMQILEDAEITDASPAVYTISMGKDSLYDTVEHLLKVPTKDGVIKLSYKVKLIKPEDVTLELPEKALKYEEISNDIWHTYRDYIEIMSSVAYCETEYQEICNIINENYNITIDDLVAKIKRIND